MDFLFCKECHSNFQKKFILEPTLRPQIVCPFCGSSNLAQSVDELPQIKKIESESIQKSDLSTPQIEEAEGDAACGKMQAPFDDRKNGFWGAYFKNIQALLFHPQDYFKKYQLFHETKTAWFFAILNYGLLQLWNGLLFIAALFLRTDGHSIQYLREIFGFVLMFIILGMVVFLVLFPILQSFFVFLCSMLHHFFLVIIGGTKKSFSHTLQVYYLFSFVFVVFMPFYTLMALLEIDSILNILGGTCFFIYSSFYFIQNMAEIHEISKGKAVWSLLAGTFVMFLIAILLLIYLGAPLVVQFLKQLPNQ